MDEKYRIYNQDYNTFYKNFFKFYKDIDENFNEIDVLPLHYRDDFIKHKNKLDSNIKLMDTTNYLENIKMYQKLFSSLKKSKINGLAYKALLSIENNATILSTLKQFKPQQGYSDIVCYDNASNVSGRLIVKKGPNILVLPKRCRNIFESRFANGSILSVDFANLEPRLCLKLAGKNIKGDLYDEINKILEFEIDRSVIKRAIISTLYGANYENFKNISANKAKILFEAIHNFFELENLYKISKNIDDNNIRRNFFGRPIWNLNETRKNVLINNYIQSSAVDIALQYFHSLINKINLEKAMPIFIIHDAIIFDIQKDYINEFNNIIISGYNSHDLGNFPVSISRFNTKNS